MDLKWIFRRFVTLGFVEEPWRRAKQESGIPSAGNFESAVYHPNNFRTLVPQAAFREMTVRDAYWGAKIVASFSDAQIKEVVGAVGYEDPRAVEFITRRLIERRDKTVRYWFNEVAPLDFFMVRDQSLQFHDLLVDIGQSVPRQYDVSIEAPEGPEPTARAIRLESTSLDLARVAGPAARLELEFRIVDSDARPTRVELTRKEDQWTVTRVRHG